MAIPARASIENTRNVTSFGATARAPRPATTASSATSVTRWTPRRAASVGATAPKHANASTGREVRSPVVAPFIPSPCRTSARTGPTLTAAGRRLNDRRTRPTRMSALRREKRLSMAPGRIGAMRIVTDIERRARIGRRHALAPSHRVGTPEDVTRALTVLHSTEPATVHLSVQARAPEVAVADVERALYDERTLVKQLAMRRTLFVFPRDLLPAAWGSASARVAAQLRPRLAKEVEAGGLAPDGAAWVDAACAAVLAHLEGGRELSAQELREQVPELEG